MAKARAVKHASKCVLLLPIYSLQYNNKNNIRITKEEKANNKLNYKLMLEVSMDIEVKMDLYSKPPVTHQHLHWTSATTAMPQQKQQP